MTISDIQNALDTIVGHVTTLQVASGAGRTFELFVMTRIAHGLHNQGFGVWLQRSDGTIIRPGDPDRRFIQRGGAPTGVSAASNGPGNASVIGFRRGQNYPTWEIWNGIQFAGRSTALHEIDISIVPGSVGHAIRTNGGTPVGRPRVSIECKDSSSTGSLDEMRAFVARLYDITLLKGHHRYLTFPSSHALHPGSPIGLTHDAAVTFRDENYRTKNIIARQTGFASGTVPLSKYYRIEPHPNISVGSSTVDDLVNTVVDWATTNA